MSKIALFTAFLAVLAVAVHSRELQATASPAKAPAAAPAAASSIAQFIASQANLSTLSAALSAVHLTGELGSDFEGTVFAPTNDAFAKLLTKLGVSATTLLKEPELVTQVLSYHVSPEIFSSSELSKGLSIPTYEGGSITVKAVSPSVQLLSPSGDVATVTKADIVVGKGVVYLIDTVLLPAGTAGAPAPAPAKAPAKSPTKAPAKSPTKAPTPAPTTSVAKHG